MKLKKIWAMYFSPTGTTAKAVNTAARALVGVSGAKFETFDFTLPDAREGFPPVGADELAVFGVPTYAGRVPNVLLKYLSGINGNDALAVPLVTFGNRSFDNSLRELCDILEDAGFHTAAAMALSCEHSFSDTLGAGRPDSFDLMEIQNFMLKAYIKLSDMSAPCPPVNVPGVGADRSYGGYYQPRDRSGETIDIRKVTPVVDTEKCVGCGLCAARCSMGSIMSEDVARMRGICIKCCACVKGCPQGARRFDDAGFLYHKGELEAMYARRAENRFFVYSGVKSANISRLMP